MHMKSHGFVLKIAIAERLAYLALAGLPWTLCFDTRLQNLKQCPLGRVDGYASFGVNAAGFGQIN